MNIHENRVSSEQIRRRQSDSIVPSSTRLLHGSVDVVVVSAAEDPIFERNFFDSIEQEDQEYTPRYNHHVYRSFSALESSGKQNTMHDQSDDMCMFNLTLGNGSNDESLVNETNDSLDHGETIHMPQNLTEELNVETSDDCHKLDFEIESPKVTLDDFHMITLIGLGAYGKVYLVQERVSNEIYAMKVIKKHVVLQKNLMRHTHEERNVLTTVKHPFIVTLKYAFQTEHKLYLIMEYIQGGELFTRLNEENCFLEHVAVFYAAEIVLAFDHLHSMDVIYRDL